MYIRINELYVFIYLLSLYVYKAEDFFLSLTFLSGPAPWGRQMNQNFKDNSNREEISGNTNLLWVKSLFLLRLVNHKLFCFCFTFCPSVT